MTEIPNETIKSSSGWMHWVEPWYLSYALAGATIAGLIPILLPLAVIRTSNANEVGLVIAAVNLGGLSAPLWGNLADRYRVHRWLLLGGLGLAAMGLIAFALTKNPILWIIMALLQGVGFSGANTVANLFVVESHIQAEWDERIAWLQTFYGGGQVLGLLAAGLISQWAQSQVGLWVAAGVSALAGLVGWLTTHRLEMKMSEKPILLHPSRSGEWSPISPQNQFHHFSVEGILNFSGSILSSFGFFLLVWLLTFAGAAAVFSLYPVLMQALFKISPGMSSSFFALAAGLGLLIYSPAGAWSDRLGSARVFLAGLVIRLAALIAMLCLGLLQLAGSNWWALGCFALVVLAWSLLSVSGTELTARLSPVGEGAGMGLFNATTGIAGVLGAGLGGYAAAHWGYNGAIVLAVIGMSLGLLLALPKLTLSPRGLSQESKA